MELIVDLRKELPSVRDQGERPTCLAFATSCGHSHKQGLKEWLSPEYLSYFAKKEVSLPNHEEGLTLESISCVLEKIGQPRENQCPYRGKPIEFLDVMSGTFKCVSTIASPDFDDIWRYIENNNVVILCTGITKAFFYPTKDNYIDDLGEDIQGRHAVLAMGIAVELNKRYLFIMNSWGDRWAEKGYAWITEDFFNRYVSKVFQIKDVV